MAMMMGEDFQYVLRILNTNVDGRQKVMYAMCAIKGIGRRLSCLICKKADIDLTKKATRSLAPTRQTVDPRAGLTPTCARPTQAAAARGAPPPSPCGSGRARPPPAPA